MTNIDGFPRVSNKILMPILVLACIIQIPASLMISSIPTEKSNKIMSLLEVGVLFFIIISITSIVSITLVEKNDQNYTKIKYKLIIILSSVMTFVCCIFNEFFSTWSPG